MEKTDKRFQNVDEYLSMIEYPQHRSVLEQLHALIRKTVPDSE